MLFKFDLDYSDSQKIKELPIEQYEELRKVILCFPEKQDNYWAYSEGIIDSDGIVALITLDIKPKIHSIKNTYSPQKQGSWINDFDKAMGATHIHIPNIGLLTIDNIIVEEDACTNEIQGYLNRGWKILAICPPNGVRRPDYILGRSGIE